MLRKTTLFAVSGEAVCRFPVGCVLGSKCLVGLRRALGVLTPPCFLRSLNYLITVVGFGDGVMGSLLVRGAGTPGPLLQPVSPM